MTGKRPAFETTADVVAAIPQDFRDNHWIVYHGTSGYLGDTIERDGFRPEYHFNIERLVERVICLYDDIGWWGIHRGGFAMLKSFSAFDYSHRIGATFFAIHPNQASLYATRELQGGEKRTALRLCISDLKERIRDCNNYDDNLAEKEIMKIEEFISNLDEDDASLIEDLPSANGILYGIRLTKQNLDHLDYNGHMGLMSFAPIAPAHICMKMIVPAECRWVPEGSSLEDIKRLSPSGNDLFAAMLDHRTRKAGM